MLQCFMAPPQVLQTCSVKVPVFTHETTLFSQSAQDILLADFRVTKPLSPAAVVTLGDLKYTVWHLLQVMALWGVEDAWVGAAQELRKPAAARVARRSSRVFIGCGRLWWLLLVGFRWLVRKKGEEPQLSPQAPATGMRSPPLMCVCRGADPMIL